MCNLWIRSVNTVSLQYTLQPAGAGQPEVASNSLSSNRPIRAAAGSFKTFDSGLSFVLFSREIIEFKVRKRPFLFIKSRDNKKLYMKNTKLKLKVTNPPNSLKSPTFYVEVVV